MLSLYTCFRCMYELVLLLLSACCVQYAEMEYLAWCAIKIWVAICVGRWCNL